ncbi:conserved hypothetical protein [Burkholderiales bacterium 8X]|nr:conserved hypothetical protein [Burkholderiales bacterium 8X]
MVVLTFAAAGLAGTALQAQPLAVPQALNAPDPAREAQRVREREAQVRQQQQRDVDVHLEPATAEEAPALPVDEEPCIDIRSIVLQGEHGAVFQWAIAAAAGPDGKDDPIGRCLGVDGINIVAQRIQRAIVLEGYVATQVLVDVQDLAAANGRLVLSVLPGVYKGARYKDGNSPSNPARLRAAIPASPGDLLNIRDIEQALENLQRVPTAEADIVIDALAAQGGRPGEVELVVSYKQPALPLRATVGLEDSGTRATGRLQSSTTLSWDDPTGLNDMLVLDLSKSAFNGSGKGTKGVLTSYVLPWGDWQASINSSRNTYHQWVEGQLESYLYAGEATNADIALSRLIYRDKRRKTTMSLRGFRQATRNRIDDEEVGPQRRAVAGFEMGLSHREFIADGTLDAALAYRRGTGAFGARRSTEEAFDEGTSRFRLVTAQLNYKVPFRIGGESFRYDGLWRAQWNRSRLGPQERFAIGGRQTVRGFDGEATLTGDRGWLMRNEVAWSLAGGAAELYAGFDHGTVGGPSAQGLESHVLAGAAIGVRWSSQGLNADAFIGRPLRHPEGMQVAGTAAGFRLSYSF